MAGVTNLFRAVTSTTGTFFTFSEVSKQLTKSLSNPQVTIMPSKFVCLNLPDFEMTDEGVMKTGDVYFPNVLQNYFENKATYLAQASENEELSTSNYIYSLKDVERSFWAAIRHLYPQEFKINFDNRGNGNLNYLQEISHFITYIGDINIQNYEEYDNMGYSEIFLHIPHDAKPIKNVLFDANDQAFHEVIYKNGNPNDPMTILGYPDGLPYTTDELTLTNRAIVDKEGYQTGDTKGTYHYPEYYIGYNSSKEESQYTGLTLQMLDNYLSEDVETLPWEYDTDADSIKFNAILVYFRIVSNNGLTEDLSETDGIDIPYGLYITSNFKDNERVDEDGNELETPPTSGFKRGIEKYINKNLFKDTSVYTEQTGSGYVLRIIARYLSVPNGTVYPVIEYVNDADIDTTQKVTLYSELMAYIQQSQRQMEKYLSETYDIRKTINEIYTGVQWNQFNVPQIFKKGNNYWWYINFKNTGHRANGLSAFEVYLDTLPKDEDGNPIDPPTVEEWLDSLVMKSVYKRVLYSSEYMDKGIIKDGKEWGGIYPDLYEQDEQLQPIIGEYRKGLIELIEDGELIPGMIYEVVDYQTFQNNVNLETPNDYMPICVQASAVNMIRPEAWIVENPEWRLLYDPCYKQGEGFTSLDEYTWAVKNNTSKLKGVILKSWNEKYDVSFPYDIFGIKFTRPDDVYGSGMFTTTFPMMPEISPSFWPSNIVSFHIEPCIYKGKRFLNNIVFVPNGASDTTLTNVSVGGSTNTQESNLGNMYTAVIFYQCELMNVHITDFSIKDGRMQFLSGDGQNADAHRIANIDFRYPFNEANEYFNWIEIGGERCIDPHIPTLNIASDPNIYKEVVNAYYYQDDNYSGHTNGEPRKVSLRPILRWAGSDGTTQALVLNHGLK